MSFDGPCRRMRVRSGGSTVALLLSRRVPVFRDRDNPVAVLAALPFVGEWHTGPIPPQFPQGAKPSSEPRGQGHMTRFNV